MTRVIRSIPSWVWLVALLVGVVHMAPYWRAAAVTPKGWQFTGNLSSSPDYMQYRVWMRQTQEQGILVSNRFTAEPTRPYLPVLMYWGIGSVSAVSGVAPEWVYAWLGAILAVVFTVILFVVVRHFAPRSRATAWIFGTLLLGGGLGGYIKMIERWEWARGFSFVNSLLFKPMVGEGRVALFENFRGNYIIQAVFDSHFMLFWLVSTVTVGGLYLTIRRFSLPRLAITAGLFAFSTYLHVYEGITLLFIAIGALFMCWRKGLPTRTAVITASACAAAVGVCLLALLVVFRLSGASSPDWRGLHVLPSILLLAYPLAWLLIAWGGIRYWLEGGIDEAFLVGWAIGCLMLIAAGPFFPYPDRATMTLQIPLFIVAGSIYFRNRNRVGFVGTIIVVLLLGSTPVWMARSMIERTTFDPDENHKWVSADHIALAGVLSRSGSHDDLLLAEEVPLRWLAPTYAGRHYAGHFFLTSNYETKRTRVRDFYTTLDSQERAEFLRDQRITLVYEDATDSASSFRAVPGLRVLEARPVGTLYRFDPHESPFAASHSDE